MLLAAQGLVGEPSDQPGAVEVLACIRQMGVLQIDTIHVVARSPYLVLWSRLGDYEPRVLEELLASGKLFEYWSHDACFIPIEQYPLYRRVMLDRRSKSGRWIWLENRPEAADQILAYAAEKKTVRSADFERKDGQKGNWWNWKEEKIALECLHTAGHLMIARRERFQRVYALREHILPDWSDKLAPPYEEVLLRLTAESVRCLGAAPAKMVADYFRLAKKDVGPVLEELAEKGVIKPVTVEGIPGPAYVHRDNMELAQKVISGAVRAERTVLLSPFDPVVWDRARARALFDFDYTIECYTPEPKRKYGYFVLPILHRDGLVGRLDAKAHRREGVFEVKALFLEPGIEASDELIEAIGGTLKDCAKWHGTPKVRVAATEPRGLARRIQGVANRKNGRRA